MAKAAKSEKRCMASDKMAMLLAMRPPTISIVMKMIQTPLTQSNFLRTSSFVDILRIYHNAENHES